MNIAHTFAHLLLPRSSNNHRAKIVQHSGIFAIIIVFLLTQIGIETASQKQVLGYASQISVEEVIRLTNQKRADIGLPALTVNPQLSQAASSKGTHMLAHDYWAHVAPDGTQPWKFFADANYKYRYAGENLARDFSSASAAIDGWMASPTHRDNMLSPKYKEIGIGVVEGDLDGRDTTLIVQLFGTTLADSPATTHLAQNAVATQRPVQTPFPTPIATPSEFILAQANPTPTAQILISPFATTRNVSLILLGIVLVAFIIDIVVISRRRIYRISGRTWGHVAFLGMIFTIVMILRAGDII